MESSEDDAGNATSASRRASAREKDIGQAEDVEPTRNTQHEPSEASASCTTPAMSEDNFDGDSVPSPSAQDVNTSTEAILDMIDEFVDGPGAAKRLPLKAVSDEASALNDTLEPVESLSESEPQQQTDDIVEQPRTQSPAPIDKSKSISESKPLKSEECTPQIEDSNCATSSNISSPQISSDSVDKTETSSNQQTENSAVISVEPESMAIQSVSDSPSSSELVQIVKNICDCEQSEQSERTVKCVTSSDNRDSVTVERAESTSSECSVSESKVFPVETFSRSPLKRRLVRPAPSDRRPDSTVSSTVDSQTANIHTTQPTSCDVVVKDVSSSSDAVHLQHGKVKLEEISNVSEISFCKAETSTAPKKIRLVRPKVTPVLSNIKPPEALLSGKKQCQSTSPDDHPSPVFPVAPTTSQVDTCKLQEHGRSSVMVKCVTDNASIQVLERVLHANISEAKENVITNIENATQSVCTISPSELSTIQSEEPKSSDTPEALSEVQSKSLEPSKVQSKMEPKDILQKIIEPQKFEESVLKPAVSAQIQSKEAESIEVNTSQEFSKSVSKTNILESKNIHSNEPDHTMELSEVQPKVLEASHGLSQKSIQVVTQSKHSPPTESQSNIEKPAELEKVEQLTDSQLQELRVIESQSKIVELTVVKSEDEVSTESSPSNEQEPTDIQSKQIPTKSQSKIVEQTEVQSDGELKKPPSKEWEPSENQPQVLKLTESQPKALKPSESQPKVLTPSECQLEVLEPSGSQPKVMKPSKSQPQVLKSTESQPKVLKPTESQTKVLTPFKCQPKVLEPSESKPKVLKPSESQPKVLTPSESQPKVLKLSESHPKVLTPSECQPEVLNPSESQPKVLTPSECQLKVLEPTESQTKVLTPSECQPIAHKPIEGPSKVLEPTESPKNLITRKSQSKVELAEASLNMLKPTETKALQLVEIQSKELQPADNQPRALKPEKDQPNIAVYTQTEVLITAEIPKVLKVAEILPAEVKATEAQSKLLTQSKDLKLEVVHLQHKEEQLQKTNIVSNEIEAMEVDCDSIKNEDSDSKESESGHDHQRESLPSQSGTLKKQSTEAKINALDEVQKLPPIKLTLTKVSKAEKKSNDLDVENVSKNAIVTSQQDKQILVTNADMPLNCDNSSKIQHDDDSIDQKKVRPIKLNLSSSDHNSSLQSSSQKSNTLEEKPDSTKHVPKLTIKLGNKQAEEMKSPIPKLTIKPIRPPIDHKTEDSFENSQQIPNVTKLNIKPIVKPREENDSSTDTDLINQEIRKEKIPCLTRLNIKPIPKPAEKINDMHRKSSSSEISESEYSENDETSTSDQASTSDQGPSDTVPKVTIKLGKPGTESEGKFYTEKNIPKLTIKGLHQNENDEKLKLVISQSEDATMEKIPRLTIKAVTKSEGQPLSPKLTIKPIKPPEKDNEIPKLKITTDVFGSTSEIKENMHVPKITIKAVTKTDSDTNAKNPKKSTLMCDSPDHIPIVTKLNIKPILKPMDSGDGSEELVDKVPVVSKLNIKPIVKPKDNEVDSSVEDLRKVIKLNIKPLKNPEENSSEGKDCDENIVDMVDKNIPVVTKLNIKPIFKPEEEDEGLKDSENQSSETSTSSDDNSDHIPVVTKLNIKPIVKPSELEEASKPTDQNIPVVTKLNIKPLVKPEEDALPSSPKRESLKSPGSSGIPNVTKLNIKPIVKHEDSSENKSNDDNLDKGTKNPPLVMKINMKNMCDTILDQKYNSYVDGTKSPRQPMSPKIKKSSLTPDKDHSKSITAANIELRKNKDVSPDSSNLTTTVAHSSIATYRNCLSESLSIEIKQVPDKIFSNKNAIQINEVHERKPDLFAASISPGSAKQKKSLQNCTLLKQLLSNTKDDSEKSREMSISNCVTNSEKTNTPLANANATANVRTLVGEIRKHNSDLSADLGRSPILEVPNDLMHSSKSLKTRTIQEVRKDANESVTKPLEIVTDKISNQSSGQDSPRIILKINKTDHGPSSKIITEECHRPKDSPPQNHIENTHETVHEKHSPKKHYINSRKKQAADEAVSLTIGKRLRSSRVVDTPERSPMVIRRNTGKRPSVSESSPSPTKETEISVLDAKRLKLEQLLSANKGLTITPVASNFTQTLLTKPRTETTPSERKNHSLLNNDNSKNGNSKLHNILSNLQAKQMQSLQLSESTILNKDPIIIPDAESNTSTGSSDVVVEISRIENCHPDVQEMIINENLEFRDLSTPEEVSQDPLEVDALKTVEVVNEPASIKVVEVTPTPRKRGRPRKIPLSEDAKPATPAALPVPALEERPQRSLRLMRERPAILAKPRGGRGRGRGGRRVASPIAAPRPPSDDESTETVIVIETLDEDEPHRPTTPPRPATPEDPTSSRIKLPRMTEALDKSSACMTPLSSRRRSSNDMKLFGEPSVVIESPVKIEEYMKSPEVKGTRGRGGRGRGTPRGRTPRGRGRGRGGGKGATYMKETMGIYGRVCGPATTTVELFEEETCMMDDNATPKPSHLLDEDSQSSVKSSTNESSNKMKKSKFADLFDSNKVWTASDVKEYTWPPRDVPNVDHQVMMIQEQVAMFLGVKSFKRRYAELKRRAVVGEEKDYCLRRGIVTEALCDLGITAVDASDVLDIMLSDYPHKYEEYRSYQRQKQLTESLEEAEAKLDEKALKIDIKSEKTSDKPEPPKVDPEKTRQDMAAAAIASASEWNAMANAWRRGACADLQSNTIHRRRPPPTAAPTHCRPPHGFYPHALLPGQFQHSYVQYSPDQLRYFPLNTVIAAPPAPPSPVESSSESEGSWGDSSTSSDDSHGPHHSAKRKKLTKVKRNSSQHEKDKAESAAEEVVDLCRVCKLRLEANRKYTHERFLNCAQCNAKFHPSCVELGADTIRKCREYAWQCGECKRCCACRLPPHDKMAFCELCDRAFHRSCVSLAQPPTGRWHCAECAVCKSCGAREPGGLPGAPGTPGPSGTPGTPGPSGTPAPEWHHQTRRGPGGHKVYSHSLCTPCARAYRIGRYCPLCERSFIGPKGTMQLVICKLCDRQLHQECVRATVSSLNVLDYRCAECRRGGITSRAGAVRAAPRTIATLFMAKRRFNKYAHKQYMQSRQQRTSDPEASDPLDGADNSRTDFGD